MQAALAEAAFTVSDPTLFAELADPGRTHGPCDYCAKLVRLTPAGLIKRHYLVKDRRGGGDRRRLCPGTGRPPRSRPGVER
jgi:hypothetical protein